ncbi:MAG: SDR family NAD(P)-dependent oxidoreductase [Roseovarius sp.]|nr:SDR family NAD(P)-dependent oxidoreductase [Roseovarius sp.]MCY4317547.1 SDR family NAD(P)-dependent oxidoreductase [Roseovarius sp.]
MSVNGKTILITGASRGIGAAAARAFAEAGANVVLSARSRDAISSLAESIGGSAHAVPCDVSRFQDIATAVNVCIDRFGSLDVLVGNAAAIEPISHLEKADHNAWSQSLDINVKGVFYGIRAAMPIMRASGGGTIITIGSGAASHALEGWSSYCASKAAVAMLMLCANKEGRDAGIRAMSLSPGTVATQMQRKIKASGINPVSQLDWSEHIPPEWPAKTLVWMCTEDADEFVGREIQLRDSEIRRRVGLI